MVVMAAIVFSVQSSGKLSNNLKPINLQNITAGRQTLQGSRGAKCEGFYLDYH